jgi:small-conductance mechanosensitive channel/CRP-like cAMP-binding protein
VVESFLAELAAFHVIPISISASLALFLSKLLRDGRGRLKVVVFSFALFLLCFLALVVLTSLNSPLVESVRIPCAIFGTVTAVGSISGLLFSGLLPKLKLRVPLILQDVIVGIAMIAASVLVLSRNSVNLSGLIATSAVFTAMLGFSLQDVVGNIAGGLALQLDQSISEGDWVKIGDVAGRVSEIRWRHTAVETRNWETVLIPNAVLMKSQVIIVGRRQNQLQLERRWVYFNVDFRHQPGDVMRVVQSAVRNAEIASVSKDPDANCVFIDMTDAFGKYAVRYWLNDFSIDAPTDSEVRACIYFALQRAGMTLAMPTNAIYLTQETDDRKEQKAKRQTERREALLRKLEFFSGLPPNELTALAAGMQYAPFAPGEVITKQHAEAHWLYVMEEGVASVRVKKGASEEEVAQLSGPTVFGEMSLLTGEKRAATVIARSEVECFKIDRSAIEVLVKLRPELANQLAQLLAQRKVALDVARENLDTDEARRRQSKETNLLLSRIKSFLNLDS